MDNLDDLLMQKERPEEKKEEVIEPVISEPVIINVPEEITTKKEKTEVTKPLTKKTFRQSIKPTKKQRILVTGATGFIGSFIVKKLVSLKKDVVVLARESSSHIALDELREQGAHVVVGSLSNEPSLEKALEDVDIVIHCAALHSEDKEKMQKSNVEGTRNLLEACLRKDVQRFVYLSSATTFGKVENGNENSERKPETPYAKTKLQAENLVKMYMNKGIRATIIIPPIVYGLNARCNMMKWLKYIKKGYLLIFGDGENKIETIYIDDVINAIILSLKSKNSINQTYVVSGQTTTMNEFTNTMADIQGVKKPKHIPVWLAKTLAIIITGISKVIKISSPLTLIKVKNMTRNRSLDMSKAKKELEYEPKTSMHEGLTNMIKWCEEEGYL